MLFLQMQGAHSLLYPRHTGGAVPLRVLVKTAITVVTPPVDFNSFPPTRHTRLPQ